MQVPDSASRDGRRLLRAGILLFLLALLVGFAVPHFALPRLGLSAHLLGVMQGMFLLVAGLVWLRLRTTPTLSRFGSFLALYGCLAAWLANLLGAMWGAGSAMMPLAAGQARGTTLQEGVIRFGLITGAISLVAVAALMSWGLRSPSADEHE